MLPHTDIAEAEEVAARVLAAIDGAGEASVTATIGIAALGRDSRHTMLEADLALYGAKTAGGIRSEWPVELGVEVGSRSSSITAIVCCPLPGAIGERTALQATPARSQRDDPHGAVRRRLAKLPAEWCETRLPSTGSALTRTYPR